MKRISAFILLVSIIGLAGCGGAATPAPLPTATAAPTQAPPEPSATPLPPPTVTPFPTATPRPTIPPTPAPTEATSDDAPAEADATATPASEEATPEPTQVATASPTTGGEGTVADLARGPQIYNTVFTSGWPEITDDATNSRSATEDGSYVFDLAANRRWVVATTVLTLDDFIAEIDVTPESCPEGAGYGLFFRYGGGNNYFALTLFCSGRVTVFTRSDGTLVQPPLVDTTLPAGLDASSANTHQIGIAAQGDEFAIMFDGEVVATFTSDLHPTGDIALYAVSASDAGMRVAFDNLEVYRVR